MLTTLRIKNLALVSDLTLELQPGCNVITGETGAGKSIIIGALNLVLGERADRTLIRSGEESCSVEAVFDTKKLRAPLKIFLDENGLEPCEENQLVLKRNFSASGTNRQFVNGSVTTLATLATIGEWMRKNRHLPVREQWRTINQKLVGHYRYYGITGNSKALGNFRYEVGRRWRGWLNRRSQRARMIWERMNKLLARFPLAPAISYASRLRQQRP